MKNPYLFLFVGITAYAPMGHAEDTLDRLTGTWRQTTSGKPPIFPDIHISSKDVAIGCRAMPYKILYHDKKVYEFNLYSPSEHCPPLGCQDMDTYFRVEADQDWTDESWNMNVYMCATLKDLKNIHKGNASCSWGHFSKVVE